MYGCKICQSASLIEAVSLRCGHQFCKECLLSLLPDPGSHPVSILPEHIAVVICPRCHERCEYTAVHGERLKQQDGGATRAPSLWTDEAAKRRFRKRAQFIQMYRREYDYLNRTSRSRFCSVLEEDNGRASKQCSWDDNLARSSDTFRRTRFDKGDPTKHVKGGLPDLVSQGRGVDDVRAIDHVTGRFITCIIISNSDQTQVSSDAEASSHPIEQQPRSPGPCSPYIARASRREFHRPARSELAPFMDSPSNFLTGTQTTKFCCLDSDIRRGIVAGMFVSLLIAVIIMTSIISSSS
ncbi:uncharacterized protein LOC110974188 [Acanthaster planci]|uniref:Uncharacterized protein LOC110974188 n=1 Tax=Acanthaster planci TaxID=133434 RepID=A0A8B7XKJ8_ACAPL|nr:uncharacterized protein LOC110974188 [Acanthaster planci]